MKLAFLILVLLSVSVRADDNVFATTNVVGTTYAVVPVLTQTNFTLNTVYTNSARVAHVRANSSHSIAAVVGVNQLRLYADQAGGTSFALVAQASVTTLITSLVITENRELGAWLAANATYYWTNSSTGVGNSSAIVSGTGQIIRW